MVLYLICEIITLKIVIVTANIFLVALSDALNLKLIVSVLLEI